MGDKFKLVLKIEEVMTTKFFDGKSMEDILDDITIHIVRLKFIGHGIMLGVRIRPAKRYLS